MGRWTSRLVERQLTFTEINMDAAAEKKASDEGCDLAILEALRGKELPMTLDSSLTRRQGEGHVVIDASSSTRQRRRFEHDVRTTAAARV